MSRTIKDFKINAMTARKAFITSNQPQLVIMIDWLLQLANDVEEQFSQTNSKNKEH